jgi:nucleotide-binding universal stress UspA family protein
MPKTMLERVLIPLDGSERAESILSYLEPILRRTGSEIFLVRALTPSSGSEAPLREADAYLNAVADRFQRDGLCTHALLSVGVPHQVIESFASDEEVTLIAMSTQGHGASGVPVGPVTERVLQGSTKTVLALPPAGSDHVVLQPHRGILVPLDGSETSRRSLPLALELAAALDARLILMRVIEARSDEVEVLHDLHDVAARLNRQGLIAEIWVETGDAVEKILQVCRDEDIQLIAMTTQGRGGESAERPFGRVTRQVMSRSPVPVLAVHARG